MPVKNPGFSEASGPLPGWKLEDAKAQFSDLVRRARDAGPQRVTLRGQDAVVVLSAADYARLAPAAGLSLAALFGAGPFAELETFDETSLREQAPFGDPVEF